MRYLLLSDSHLKHEKMRTYCARPEGFSELIHKNCMERLGVDTTLIHLGDVGIARPEDWLWMVRLWPGKKILVRGNHDRKRSLAWWSTTGGFDFACDGLRFRDCWLTHEPARSLPEDCKLNLHGHLHNIWDGFHSPERLQRDKELLGEDFKKRLKNSWQRLLACEYTKYCPIEHPLKYQATGPTGAANG
jgi:calcineurin-like phosphoesterase family protein